MLFKLGIIVACAGGLTGLLLINSRLVKACIMAGLSGAMLLLIGMLTKMAKYEYDLFRSVNTHIGNDLNNPNPEYLAPDVSAYLVTHYQKHHSFLSEYHFTYWVLLTFLLIAPFVMAWQRKKSSPLRSVEAGHRG